MSIRRSACLAAAVAAIALGEAATRAHAGGDGPPSGAPAPAPARAPADPAAAPAAAPDAVEAQKMFEQGEVLREEGKWAEAAQVYGHSLDKDESAWLTHVRYQEAVIGYGHGKELIAEYDDSVKKYSQDPTMKLHRMRLDPPAQRIAALSKLVQGKVSDPYVLLELGRAQLAAGDAAGAKKSLEAAFAQKPDDTREFLLLSVDALRQSGDAAGARARLGAAVKSRPDLWDAHLQLARLDLYEEKFADAAKRAEQVIAMRPSYVAAFLVKSEAASRLGKVEDALTALEAVQRINPADVDSLIAWADLTARKGTEESLKKAVDGYKKALAANSASLRAEYGLAWVFERQNSLNDSLAAYREAMLLAPSDAGVVNSVGVILLKQKRFQDAVLQFTKAIDLDPAAPEAYNNMGSVSDAQSDWNEAIKWYAKVLHMRGQDKNVRALLNAAFDYEALGSYAKAEEMLQKVRTIRPEDDDVITFLGDNLYFQHKWKEAVKAYRDAVKINVKNRFAWRGLGFALVQDDKDEDGVDALEHAKELKADDQQVLLILGDEYLQLKNPQKALDNYEAYVKAGGNDPDIPTRIEQIKKDIAAGKK